MNHNDPNNLGSAPPGLVDTRAAMKIIGTSDRTIARLTRINALPHRKIGRLVRFCPEELRLWIAAGCPTTPNAADVIRQGVGR